MGVDGGLWGTGLLLLLERGQGPPFPAPPLHLPPLSPAPLLPPTRKTMCWGLDPVHAVLTISLQGAETQRGSGTRRRTRSLCRRLPVPSSHLQGLHPTDRGPRGSVLAGRLLEGPASTASQRAGLSHKPASFCAQEASETQPRAASQPQRPEPTASLKTENVGEGLPTLDVSRDAAESVAASEEVRATPSVTAIAMGP